MKEKIKEYQFTLELITEHGNDSALLSLKNEIETEILKLLNPLIFKMAKYFNNNYTLNSDFIQEGRMGVIEAMEKYDCESTLGFPLYSKFYIKKYMVALHNELNPVKMPDNFNLLLQKYRKVSHDKSIDIGRWILENSKLGMNIESTKKLLERYVNTKFVSVGAESSQDNSDGYVKNETYDLKTESFEDDVVDKIPSSFWKDIEAIIGERYTRVLKLHSEGMIFEEIAKLENYSRQRASEICKIAKKKLANNDWFKMKYEAYV